MKKLIILLTSIVTYAFSNVVISQDQTATLSWTAPTERTDGTPLEDLAGFKIYWGVEEGEYTHSATIETPNASSYVVTGLERGTTYYFAATAFDSEGLESDFSNVATKTTGGIPGSFPNSPTNLVVTQNNVVYTIVQSRNRIVLVPAGTVPVGTPCDYTQEVNGKFLVQVELVDWVSARPETAFAECSSSD